MKITFSKKMIPRFVRQKKKKREKNKTETGVLLYKLSCIHLERKLLNIRRNEMSPSKHKYALEREV